jgi:hypothetical protein
MLSFYLAWIKRKFRTGSLGIFANSIYRAGKESGVANRDEHAGETSLYGISFSKAFDLLG